MITRATTHHRLDTGDMATTYHHHPDDEPGFGPALWDATPGVCCAAFQLGACAHTEGGYDPEPEDEPACLHDRMAPLTTGGVQCLDCGERFSSVVDCDCPEPVDQVATDRREDEPCERGTVGCCIAHRATGPEGSCHTW